VVVSAILLVVFSFAMGFILGISSLSASGVNEALRDAEREHEAHPRAVDSDDCQGHPGRSRDI
jgi:hypothetical protein